VGGVAGGALGLRLGDPFLDVLLDDEVIESVHGSIVRERGGGR
jgi:hypothetical protein